MGLCGMGIDKDHVDQREKATNQTIRRRSESFQFRQIRQVFDKMSKFFNTTSEPLGQSAHGARPQITLEFQNAIMKHASPAEKDANRKLLEVRQNDRQFYTPSHSPKASGSQLQAPFPEDHFSRNVHIIEKTGLFKAARIAPKGTHLHVHFNSTLLPNFLLDIAEEMPNMYISSPTHKLRSKSDFDDCEIVFNLLDVSALMNLPEDLELRLSAEDAKGPNLFHDTYEKGQKMRYRHFRNMWDVERRRRQGSPEPGVWAMNMKCDEWLTSKLMFTKEDVELIFHPEEKLSDAPRAPESKEEERARQKKAEEAGWSKDIELAFQDSPYNAARKRATRYFVRDPNSFMHTG